MATKGKKKTTKKNGSGSNIRVSQAKKTTAKKPASFSKTVAKDKFSEFETLDLKMVQKTSSKIIVRDVAKEDPKTETKVEIKSKAKTEPKVEAKTEEIIVEKKKETISKPEVLLPKISAKEIKEQEINKAIKAASKIKSEKPAKKSSIFGDFGLARAILVIACTATAAFALVYFINLATNDMSIKVAAMQSGIDANYPSYIPRGYSLSDVSSTSGKIAMSFKKEDGEYQIVEENSSWDSDALLNNYITEKYGNEYTVVLEQGLTLYMGDTWEAWVNGGVLYKLTVKTGSLTKKQMRAIAASL